MQKSAQSIRLFYAGKLDSRPRNPRYMLRGFLVGFILRAGFLGRCWSASARQEGVRCSSILSSKLNHVDDILWSLGSPIFLFLPLCVFLVCVRVSVVVFPGDDNDGRSDRFCRVSPLFLYSRCSPGGGGPTSLGRFRPQSGREWDRNIPFSYLFH
jgi:hypothetical protein